jgi:hypothetical protein
VACALHPTKFQQQAAGSTSMSGQSVRPW